jgi:hypothetical protein
MGLKDGSEIRVKGEGQEWNEESGHWATKKYHSTLILRKRGNDYERAAGVCKFPTHLAQT